MQDIARKANDILQSKNVHITLISIPTYEEICAHDREDRDALPPLQPIDDDRVLIIAHSSGNYCITIEAMSDALRIYIIPQDHTSHPEVLQQNSRTTYTGLLWCTIQAGYSYYSCPDLVDLSARVQAAHGAAMFRMFLHPVHPEQTRI
jgi:hypothetical protein